MTQAAPWQTLLENNAAKLLETVNSTRESILTEGAMLCDALLAHPDGVANIANRARAAGATEDEIAETLAVAFLFGSMPALVTGTNAFRK